MTIKLTKSITVKGKKIDEIDLNLDKLTGKDLIAAETEVRAMGDNSPVIAASLRYQAAVVARVVGAPVDDILELHAVDFQRVTTQAMNFLFGSASQTEPA